SAGGRRKGSGRKGKRRSARGTQRYGGENFRAYFLRHRRLTAMPLAESAQVFDLQCWAAFAKPACQLAKAFGKELFGTRFSDAEHRRTLLSIQVQQSSQQDCITAFGR